MTQATTTAVFFFCFFFNDVVTYWTMIRTHVVPDSSTMGTHQLHLTWFTTTAIIRNLIHHNQ